MCHMLYYLSNVNLTWIVVINIIVEPTNNRVQAHALFCLRYDVLMVDSLDTVISN